MRGTARSSPSACSRRRISLLTVIATLGTAQDVTADELRIESFFPADEATERLFRQAHGGRA